MSCVSLLKSTTTLLVACYLVVACLVIPLLCRQLPFSMYYDKSLDSNKRILSMNAERLSRARASLFNVSFSFPEASSSGSSPDLCIVVITARRLREIFTLTQVVASLAPQLAGRRDVVFAVYNVDREAHTEAVKMAEKVPVVTPAHGRSEPLSFDKEKRDYVSALEWCRNSGARFVAALEDDALPTSDFVSRLEFILDHRMNKYSKDWSMLKLFYPEKYEGWSNDFNIILELIGTTALGGILLTSLSACLLPLPPSRRAPLLVMRLIASLLFTLVLLRSVGRPHWLALRSLSVHLSAVVQAPGCCTPAVVYPSWHLPRLLSYLRSQNCSQAFPIDLALDSFARSSNLQRWLVVPNMVKHIGFVSSLPGKGWKHGQAQE